MPKWGEGPPAGGVERVRGVLARARGDGFAAWVGQRAALGLCVLDTRWAAFAR